MNVNGNTYYVRLHVSDTDDRNRTILVEDIPLHDLNVGDTLKITELSTDGRYCKAKIISKGTYAEKRHMIGMSTFGSAATALVVNNSPTLPSPSEQTGNTLQSQSINIPVASLDMSDFGSPALADFYIKKPTVEEPAKIQIVSEISKLTDFGPSSVDTPSTNNLTTKPTSPNGSFVTPNTPPVKPTVPHATTLRPAVTAPIHNPSFLTMGKQTLQGTAATSPQPTTGPQPGVIRRNTNTKATVPVPTVNPKPNPVPIGSPTVPHRPPMATNTGSAYGAQSNNLQHQIPTSQSSNISGTASWIQQTTNQSVVPLRIFFRDGSWRAIGVHGHSTVAEIVEAISKKVNPQLATVSGTFVLLETAVDGSLERVMSPDECPLSVANQWKDKNAFRLVFSVDKKVAKRMSKHFQYFLQHGTVPEQSNSQQPQSSSFINLSSTPISTPTPSPPVPPPTTAKPNKPPNNLVKDATNPSNPQYLSLLSSLAAQKQQQMKQRQQAPTPVVVSSTPTETPAPISISPTSTLRTSVDKEPKPPIDFQGLDSNINELEKLIAELVNPTL